MREKYECCRNYGNIFVEIKNGKVSFCDYSGFASTAGINEDDEGDWYDLNAYRPEELYQLMEFRMGYNNKGYASLPPAV